MYLQVLILCVDCQSLKLRQYASLKHLELLTILHSVTSQKTWIFISTAVRILYLKAVITFTCVVLDTFPHFLDIVLLLFVLWLLHNSSCSIHCQNHEHFLFSCSPGWQRTAHKALLQTEQDALFCLAVTYTVVSPAF